MALHVGILNFNLGLLFESSQLPTSSCDIPVVLSVEGDLSSFVKGDLSS